MTLKLIDFVAETDGVEIDDFPPGVQSRIDGALANLTDGDGGPGNDPNQVVVDGTAGEGDFDTIQAAIDAIDAGDADGDIVLVRPGTYGGPESGVITVDVPGLTLSSAQGPDSTTVGARVVVSADGVGINALTVSPPPATGNQVSEAIRVSGAADDVTIANNVVADFERDDPDGGFYGVDGINVFGGDATEPIENVTVANNTIEALRNEDEGRVAGVSVQGNVDGATVENNALTDLGEGVTHYGFGVTIRGTGNHSEVPQSVDIVGNDVGPVTSDDRDLFGVGLGVEADGSGYVAENNDIEAAELGVEIKAAADETELVGNAVAGSDIVLGDVTGEVDLGEVVVDNEFGGAAANDPAIEAYAAAIFPSLQGAIDATETGGEIGLGNATYDAPTIDVAEATVTGLPECDNPTIQADADTGRVEIAASGVEISGVEIDLLDGEVVYANPGDGLTFADNVVDVSPSSEHGIRVDDGDGAQTVVQNNVFDLLETDTDFPQAILFSNGSDYLIADNDMNGPDAGQAVLASVQGEGTTTDMEITNNDIDDWAQGVLLFENPPSGEVDSATITGNDVDGTDTGVRAFEQNGDGFDDINGESETAAQESALADDNEVESVSVEVGADIGDF